MKSFTASQNHIGAAILVFALFASAQTATAKVGVPYGEDGSPPDSDTQAKADAFNDVLNGPKEGQSPTSWLGDLKVAHDALFSPPLALDADASVPRSGGGTGGGGPTGSGRTEIDLCASPFSDWVNWVTDPGKPVSQVLSDAALKEDVEFALEDIIYYQLAVGTAVFNEATSPHLEVARPTVSGLSCKNDTSAFSATVPVERVWLGATLDHASVSLQANATYMDGGSTGPSWCIYVTSYDIKGLIGGSALLDEALREDPFCWPAHIPPLGGTRYP